METSEAEKGMTPTERRVFAQLRADHWRSLSSLASSAGIRGWTARESAAKFCRMLERKGLAVSTPDRGQWRLSPSPAKQEG